MWISLTGLNSLGPTHQWLEPDQPPWCWLASHLLGSDSGLWVWEIQLGSHLSYAYLGQDTPRQQSRQRCAWLCTSTMLLLPPPPHVTASCHLGTSLLSWIDAPESSSTHGEGQQPLGEWKLSYGLQLLPHQLLAWKKSLSSQTLKLETDCEISAEHTYLECPANGWWWWCAKANLHPLFDPKKGKSSSWGRRVPPWIHVSTSVYSDTIVEWELVCEAQITNCTVAVVEVYSVWTQPCLEHSNEWCEWVPGPPTFDLPWNQCIWHQWHASNIRYDNDVWFVRSYEKIEW